MNWHLANPAMADPSWTASKGWRLEVWQDAECVRAEVESLHHEGNDSVCWHVEITTGDLDMILGVCFSDPEKARAAAEQIINRWLRGARSD